MPVEVSRSLDIQKPDLLCGELTRLVVSGENTGMILTPNGLPVRMMIAQPPENILFSDEIRLIDNLLIILKLDSKFKECEHNYVIYMFRALTLAHGDKFDSSSFMRNVPDLRAYSPS